MTSNVMEYRGYRADHELAGQSFGRDLPDCLLRLYCDQDS